MQKILLKIIPILIILILIISLYIYFTPGNKYEQSNIFVDSIIQKYQTAYKDKNYIQAIKFAKELNNFAKKKSDDTLTAYSYNRIGDVFDKTDNNDSALFYHTLAHNFWLASQQKKFFSISYNQLGLNYLRKADYQNSIENFIKSIEFKDYYPIDRSYLYLMNLGCAYYQQGDYKEAINSFIESLKKYPEDKINEMSFINTLINLGLSYINIQDFTTSRKYIDSAYNLALSKKYAFSIGYSLQSKGFYFHKQNLIDSALKYYYLSMKIYDSIKTFAILNEVKMRVAAIHLENNMNEQAYKFINDTYNFFKNSFSNLLFIGENHRLRSLYFFNLNKLKDALIYADSAKFLAEKILSLSLLKDIHYQKYKIYYKLGNLQKALVELEEHNRIYQLLINQINTNYIYSLEKNLLLDAKNKEITKVYQDKEIVTHSLNITYTIIIIIFFLLIISFYLIYKIRISRKKIQEQKILLEEQNNLLNEQYKELKKQQETNQEIIKLKDMIIKVIGHDLRNPISLIYSYSELLKTKYEESYLKERLNFISMSAYNSIDLLENLIEWAKMQSNEVYSSTEKTDIKSLINDILDFFKSHIAGKNLIINLNCETDLIDTNKHYLRTIIRNLLSNAIKFAKEKSELYINVLLNNNNLEITIINHGKGITEEIIYKIYNNENIISSSGTNQELGIGIGYELIKYFLEKLNGRIIIENIKIGTSVKVMIPLTK